MVCDVLIIKNGFKGLLKYCWCCCELCNVMKLVISSLFGWTCHFYYFETWLWKVLCALRKNENLKRMYHFQGIIVHRDEYYISRDVSRFMMVTNIEGHVVRRDRCMEKYVPHGSPTERQQVCITRSDMHHYTWHYISLHCTYLSLVNLISFFADLMIALLRNLWLITIDLIIEDM